MADTTTFITGFADGALEDALASLPDWASEDTALKIQGILQKQLNLQTTAFTSLIKSLNGGNSAAFKEFNDELNKAVKNYKDENDQDPKRRQRNKEKQAESDKRKKRWKDEKDSFDKRLFLEAALIKTGLSIEAVFKNNVKTFDELNAAGVNVVNGFDKAGDGFHALEQMSVDTGVRFTELAASITKYSSAVNAFGLGNFAKTVKSSTADLLKFGFSSKESADLLGSYLDVQQGIADVSQKTTEETTSDLKKFAGNIQKLTLATGMSRAAILANLEAISKSTDAAVLQGQVGTDAADSTLEFISSIKDQNFGKALLTMMTNSIKPLNNTFMSFQKIGQGAFGQKMLAFTNSLKGMDPEQARQAMKQFEAQNHAQIEYGKQQANFYGQIPELAGDAQKTLEIYNGLQQTARQTANLSAEDLKKMQDTSAASKGLQTQWEKLLASLQSAFAPSITMLNMFTHVLEGVNWIISGISSILPDVVKDWGAMAIGISATVVGLTLFGYSLKKMAAQMLGFGGGGKKGKGWTSSLGADGSGGKGGAAGGGLLSGLGKGIGDLGKGIGAGVGGAIKGLLTGLADGLTALGKPQVLLGILALAGVAAALWITSQAVQGFIDVKWEDLAKAGVALVGLGLAGAAAGAAAPLILLGAAALGAMGLAVGVLAADSIIAGKGFDAIGKGVDTISTAIKGFNGLDTLKDIVKTVNSIDLTKMLALGALSIFGGVSLPKPTPAGAGPIAPRSSGLNSPSAVPAGGDTQAEKAVAKDPSKPVGAGIEKPPTDTSINTVLGYQSSLLEQLLLSTNNLVSVNKDILKYTRAHS